MPERNDLCATAVVEADGPTTCGHPFELHDQTEPYGCNSDECACEAFTAADGSQPAVEADEPGDEGASETE